MPRHDPGQEYGVEEFVHSADGRLVLSCSCGLQWVPEEGAAHCAQCGIVMREGWVFDHHDCSRPEAFDLKPA
jgi:hypothetical protein